MKRSILRKTKAAFGKLHLWLGLASGLIVFIICLTGTILAFEKNLEDWFNRKVVYVKAEGKPMELDAVMANFEQTHNVTTSRARVYKNPRRAIYFQGIGQRPSERVNMYYNPYTGEPTGTINESVSNFFSQTMRLHRWLLVRNPGRLIVGVATTIFLFMLISGIVLWWPKKRTKLKNSLSINRKAPWKIINYQLHNVLGFYSLILLFVMGFSGLYIGQKWFRNGVNNVMAEAPKSSAKKDNTAAVATPKAQKTTLTAVDPINYQALIKQANELLPYESDINISLPRKEGDAITISKYPVRFGVRLSESIDLDSQTGEVTKMSTFNDRNRIQQFRYINRFLHTGELMGWPMQLLFFIACLIGTSLPITGTIIWINKMKKR